MKEKKINYKSIAICFIIINVIILLFIGISLVTINHNNMEKNKVNYNNENKNLNGKVLIVEYADFECPFCVRFYEDAYQDIKKEYIDTGLVEFEFRHFPLSSHRNAFTAALAYECANEQGQAEAYHDNLFESSKSLSNQKYLEIARDLNLNLEEFQICLEEQRYSEKIQNDFDTAREKGVRGTPTVFVNGQMIVGAVPFSTFKDAIERELNN
jgi:protein-disulfide isomerase